MMMCLFGMFSFECSECFLVLCLCLEKKGYFKCCDDEFCLLCEYVVCEDCVFCEYCEFCDDWVVCDDCVFCEDVVFKKVCWLGEEKVVCCVEGVKDYKFVGKFVKVFVGKLGWVKFVLKCDGVKVKYVFKG